MNKAKAIKLKCLECSGNAPKEVTLCYMVDCPLWTFRFGYSTNDKRYRKRMEAAKRKYPEEYEEMVRLLPGYIENSPFYRENVQIDAVLEPTGAR